ncbi:MAG: ABC transporter ATP-binding protein [Acidobacteria bacterium]|jgi:ABC-2 type transport system ATP-binding protein|nr:ABC transporter ATP-binding protein [Acidobacteriota bacterium]
MEKIIETSGLTKHYKGDIIGIEDLFLEVWEGEIYGFLGSNGAGKTTTIRLLLNLIFPTGGKAEIFGKDIVKQHLDICKDIGYLPGSIRPHKSMTGEDFLSYTAGLSSNNDWEYRQYLLDKFAFSGKDLKRKIKDYSTGMARKIALIQAFQHKPRLLIMDEPTEGLDPVMQHTFYELLKEYRDNGGTVFISSHQLREVELVCDRAAIIRKGRLVAVEKIHDLMTHMQRTIHVTFKEKIEPMHLESKAWEIIAIDVNSPGHETGLTGRLTGDMDALIKHLSKFPVRDMTIQSPGLQDIFLHYYQEDTNGR